MHAVRLAKIAQYIAIFPAFWLVAPYLIPPSFPSTAWGLVLGGLLVIRLKNAGGIAFSVEKCDSRWIIWSKNVGYSSTFVYSYSISVAIILVTRVFLKIETHHRCMSVSLWR